MNVYAEVRAMAKMTMAELKARYADLFGEQTRSCNRDYLVRRIAWRLQARADGDLSERARKRAAELADDADFAAYMNNYFEAVKKWWDAQGLDANDLKPLEEALAAWNTNFPAHVAAQQRAEAARQNKDAARRQLEAAARPVTAFIQAYPKTTDADRATIGITVRAVGGGDTPAPSSKPLIVIDGAGRRTHALRVVDESTPTRRARPRGVERAEVFVAFTPTNAPAPADPSAYRYVRSVSDGSAVLSFDSPEAGMQAHYLARWVTRRGAIGPWSETASATVAA